jgi:ABC-type nitrate/sulfonate/bicarbonate transport system substrate-binding protein
VQHIFWHESDEVANAVCRFKNPAALKAEASQCRQRNGKVPAGIPAGLLLPAGVAYSAGMKKLNVFICLAVSAILAGCKPASKPASHGPIRIGVLKHESALPIYVADELGLFKKHGLQVTLVEVPPGDHIPALLADRVDILTPTSFAPLFGLMLQHPDLLYAVFPGAEVTDGQTVYGFVVLSNSVAQSIKDIRSGTIIAINPYTKVNVQMILNAAGIAKSNWPDIAVASREAALQALAEGKAAVAILDQPALAVALASKQFRLLESNPRAKYVGSPYWSGAGAVKRATWTARKADFEKLMKAYDEAVAATRKDSLKAHQILAARLGLKQEIADQIGGYYFPLTSEKVDKDGIAKTVEALKSAGLIEGIVPLTTFFPPGLHGQE